MLTVGAVGWTAGSWLQARPWLRIRRDRLITVGCWSVALGLALVGLIAFLLHDSIRLVAVSWILRRPRHGTCDLQHLLGCDELVGGSRAGPKRLLAERLRRSWLRHLRRPRRHGSSLRCIPSGNLALTFGFVELSMAVVALLGVLTSLRIGVVRNEFAHS